MGENRRHDRFNIYQMIQLGFGKENYIAAEGINISEGGMLCRIGSDVDVYSKLFLLFDIPLDEGRHEIKCEGLITYSMKAEDGFDVGISFTDLSEEDKDKLRAFFQELNAD